MKKLVLSFLMCAGILSTSAQTPGQLAVSYSVPNPGTQTILSVYITNAAGTLVNTLTYRYGSNYAYQMTTFWGKIGSTYNTANFKHVGATDGSTGATINSAIATRTDYWGRTGNMATTVAALTDGVYKINFELVKNNNNRSYTSTTFTKGTSISTAPAVSPAISTFSGISATWTPKPGVGFPVVKEEKNYSVFPNPTLTTVTIQGEGIQEIEVLTLSGASIFRTNEPVLNLSSLPKGVYLAVISTDKGRVTKRIQKL